MHDLRQNPSAWLKQAAWPLWLEHGVDRRAGAFHEWLDLGSLQCDAPYRRLRVAARQIYVFAKAARHGLPGADDVVRLGLAFLREHARQADGGYAWRFGLDNHPLDHTRDLYDHAFVLLALASAHDALRDPATDAEAGALVDFIERDFGYPQGGYRESIPDQLPRRQNPHMHLLEALIAAHRAFGGTRYFERASALIRLFLDRMFQAADGALPEFFDAALVPQRDERGRYVVEPGHHYEWIWLLDDYLKLARGQGGGIEADRIEDAIVRLFAFADTFGLDGATGLAWDAVWSDGEIRDRTFRLWPQTERLKAVACRPGLTRTSVNDCRALLGRFTQGVRDGLWRERMPESTQATGPVAPASSLYHLTCALLECERLEGGEPASGAD